MAWAYVQGKISTTVSSPNAMAFTSNVTVGNTIIVVGTHSYTGCTPTCADSLGNTYTARGSKPRPTGGQDFIIFTAPVTTGGSCTVTLTYACGNMKIAGILEYSGINSSPYDTQAVNRSTANDATTGSMTTATDNELVISLWTSDLVLTITPVGATTRLTSSNGYAIHDQNKDTAGSINPSSTYSTINGTYPGWGYGAAFKEAAGTTLPGKVLQENQAVNRASTY